MYNTVVSIFGLCLLSQASVKDSIVEYDLNPTQYVTGKLKRLDKFPSKFVTPRHVDFGCLKILMEIKPIRFYI
jgi:hypothetical protein